MIKLINEKIFQDQHRVQRRLRGHLGTRGHSLLREGNKANLHKVPRSNYVYNSRDLREPLFLSIDGKLIFSFFQGGTNPIDFEPFGLFRMLRLRPGEWTEPELYGHDGEVVWEILKENGTAFSQSYSGNYSTPGRNREQMYKVKKSSLFLLFYIF